MRRIMRQLDWTFEYAALSAGQVVVEGVVFIAQAIRKASLASGSLPDVQAVAGHASLSTTSHYIEANSEARQELMNIL